MLTVQERVARGVKLLDEKRPGWRNELKFDRLSIGSCAGCVMAQLFGGYETGLVALGFDKDDLGDQYGFGLDWHDPILFRDLDREWMKQRPTVQTEHSPEG